MTAPVDIAPAAPPRRPEIRAHTGLRGVAALMVVIYHYRDRLRPAVDLDAATAFFASAGIFVDMFFILSGFIMAAIYGSWFADGIEPGRVAGFLRRRLARLYPLHLATLLLMIVIGIYLGQSAGPAEIVQNLLMIHAWGIRDAFGLNFPSWSISAEWFLYLVFPLLAFADARMAGRALLAGLALSIYAGLFAFADGIGFDERLTLLRALPSFIAGMLIFHLAAPGSRAILWPAQLGGLALFVAAMHADRSDLFVLLGFMVLIWSTRDDLGPVSAVMSTSSAVWLGSVSYSIYMLHIPVMRSMDLVWGKFAGAPTGAAAAAAFTAVCLVITLVAGHVSYRFFEMPIRRQVQARGRSAAQDERVAP